MKSLKVVLYGEPRHESPSAEGLFLLGPTLSDAYESYDCRAAIRDGVRSSFVELDLARVDPVICLEDPGGTIHFPED